MSSASIESNVLLFRGVGPAPTAERVAAPGKSVFAAQISRFRRLLSKELGCPHEQLVFDEINDVHCSQCGKDFTG
jgi:hypothetical protein